MELSHHRRKKAFSSQKNHISIGSKPTDSEVSYLNLRGTFYYMCTMSDGYSCYVAHWEIREHMKEQDVEIILKRAKETFLGVHHSVRYI